MCFLPVHHQANLLKKEAKQSPALKKFPLSISSVQPSKIINNIYHLCIKLLYCTFGKNDM